MENIYAGSKFRRIVLGAVVAATNECGYSSSKKVELLYWCSEVLDTKTIDELERFYMDYTRNDFK